MNTFPSDPCLSLQIFAARSRSNGDLLACSLFMHTRLNTRYEPFCCLAARGTKKINSDNFGKTPFKSGKIDLALCTAIIFDLSFRQGNLSKATSLLGKFTVFSTPRCL